MLRITLTWSHLNLYHLNFENDRERTLDDREVGNKKTYISYIYFLNHFKYNLLTQRASIPRRKEDLVPSCPLFYLFCNIFLINLEWQVSSLTRVMRLRTFFRLGLNLLLRDSGGLSPWNIFSRTNSDALDCSSFTRLQPLRIISFRYKVTLSSSGSIRPAAWPIWWFMCPA